MGKERQSLSEAGKSADRTMGDGSVGQTTRSCSDSLALNWRSHDHHFAPGTECLVAVYESRNLASDELTVTVTDQSGALVYRKTRTGNADGFHNFDQWNGRGNQGTWDGRLITPLESPYQVRVQARDAGVSKQFELHVLYHSIQIGLGTWTKDDAEPNQATEPAKWVQYKLNVLNYFAGPVDGVVGDQTKRAMQRYARMKPNLDPDRAGALSNFYKNTDFQAVLAADPNPRNVLAPGLPAEGGTARLYLEHNLFLEQLRDFNRPDGMWDLEAAEYDRPELPLEVAILLVGRDDTDGNGPGVAAPEAVGPVLIEWRVHDVAEDTSTLLPHTESCPTRMRNYVESVLLATRAADGSDNCPDTHGGARNTTGHVNPGYFRIGHQLPPYTSTASGNVVYSTAHDDVGAQQGKAGILFRASHIGGDDFRVEARLSFAGRTNETALIQANDALARGWDARRRVSTGKLVVWRRMPVAAVVHWPASGRVIDWARVAEEYAHAYVELIHPPAPITGDDVLNEVVPVDARKKFAKGLGAFSKTDQMDLGGDAIFNIPVPPQGEKEDARTYESRIEVFLAERLDINNKFEELIRYSAHIKEWFKQREQVGAIIFQGKWVPTIEVKVRPKKGEPVSQDYDPEVACVGLPNGLTILSQSLFADLSDQFLVAHEMGHTRFLKHHEVGMPGLNPHFHPRHSPSAHPDEHDTEDHNCTMCYPWLIPSRNKTPTIFSRKKASVDWSPNSTERSAFCGKCVLKLRGWNLAATPELPAHS